MKRTDFPKIHFYDQDFVDIYDKTWNMLSGSLVNPETNEFSSDGYFVYPGEPTGFLTQAEGVSPDTPLVLDKFETIFSSLFLVY